MNKKIIEIVIIAILLAILGGLCFGYYKKATLHVNNPIVTMEVANYGTIKIELYPDKAPNTVKNFIALANNKFYDGLKFHRVIEGFMIQGGDKEGTGYGSAKIGYLYGNEDENKYSIKGEMTSNGFDQNDLILSKGVIAMARATEYDSAGTQFFIMTTDDNTDLSGLYAGFGKVIEGMDVVENISKVALKVEEGEEGKEPTSTDTPAEDVIITSVVVDTYGLDYGYPKTLEVK